MTEELAQYIWQQRLYTQLDFYDTAGNPTDAQLIDPGTRNDDAGPDFFNAKIRLDGIVLAGSIELHLKSSDWIKHSHQQDPAYNNVILHVVCEHDRALAYRQDGSPIPYCIMQLSEKTKQKAAWLLHTQQRPACAETLGQLSPLERRSWMERLLMERLQRKSQDILQLFHRSNSDWNETCYIVLARHFGFGLNNEAMERLARSLPYRYIQKHRNSLLQVEALLLGQAGLLDEDNDDKYRQRLASEYQFLKQKFKLRQLAPASFRLHRIRPASFPQRRIAQLAALLHKQEFLFSSLINAEKASDLMDKLDVECSEYWWHHYRFARASKSTNRKLGKNSRKLLLINVLCPLLTAYGTHIGSEELIEKGQRILSEIEAESNSIVRSFTQAGISIDNAADSQAIIQLHNEYCQVRKCLFCHWSYPFLKS